MSEFRSLYEALKGWYCRPLFDYPPDLREWVDGRWKVPLAHRVKGITPAYPGGFDLNTGKRYNWNNLTPAQRIAYARQWDQMHDPATKARSDELDRFYADYEKLQNRINYWATRNDREGDAAAAIEEKLAPLEARFEAMDLKRRQMLGDPTADDEAIAQVEDSMAAPEQAASLGSVGHHAAVDNEPPGKMPNVAIGKLAVKAAWEIERKENRRATADEVMNQLILWAKDGGYSDILKESNYPRSVDWFAKGKFDYKNYDIDACRKTLENWHKSRA